MGTRRWPLALLLAAFVALATLYNLANPIFEAPDEPWHYRFVKHLADGGGLPVLQKDPTENVAGQEGGQPPLYYALSALATFWVDTGDLESLLVASPYLQGVGEGPGHFVHTPREDFPYRGTALAVHLARGLSTIMGTVTVLLTYLIGLEALRGKRPLALLAAAWVAFIPQFLFLSASVNNDNLLILLSALVLFLSLRGINRGFTLPGSLLLGAALAAAALTKVSGLALLPLSLAAFGFLSWNRRSLAPFRACLPLFPLVLLGAGWWYARNWGLYGDPLGLGFFLAAAGAREPTPGLALLLDEANRVWVSFWALFGWSNVPADLAYYAFYGALSLLGGTGLLRLAARGAKRGGSTAILLLLWSGAYVAFVAQYMRMISGMQGRLLFPALPALAVLLTAGLAATVPGGWLRHLPLALGASLFIPALLAPFLYIMTAYPTVNLLDEGQVRDIPHRLDVSYGQLVRLLGYSLEKPSFGPGQPLAITLYWQALSSPGVNYTLFIHAFDAWGKAIGAVDTPLVRGYPTAAWRTGDTLKDTYSLFLEEPEERPSAVRLEVGLYRFPSLERLPASDPSGTPLGSSVPVARIKAAAPSPPPPAYSREIPLGDQVLLAGYQVPGAALPGQVLEGSLWWKALDRPSRDYTVFVQLLGPSGLLAQYDAQPRANSYPTSLWEAGELVEDFFRLTLPQPFPEGPPGTYRLIAGMYDPSSGQRLALPAEGLGAGGEGYILLQDVTLGSGLPPY